MSKPPVQRCPACGRLMTIPGIALVDPQTAPWLCQPCGRGFWHAECSPDARAAYRPRHHDWGYGSVALRATVDQERAAARERRCSVLSELLPLVGLA